MLLDISNGFLSVVLTVESSNGLYQLFSALNHWWYLLPCCNNCISASCFFFLIKKPTHALQLTFVTIQVLSLSPVNCHFHTMWAERTFSIVARIGHPKADPMTLKVVASLDPFISRGLFWSMISLHDIFSSFCLDGIVETSCVIKGRGRCCRLNHRA